MSRIDDLIAKYCPDGVKWKPMSQVGTLLRGNGLQKKDFTDSGVGCIHYGQIYTYYGTFAYKTKTFVSESFAKKLRKAHTGDLVIATTSENDEDVCKAVAWLGAEEIAVSGDAYIYRHSLHPKYAAYFFQTEYFQKQKKRHISGTKVKRVSGDNMGKFLIPIPPLEVQQEIVSILDKFTELEAELEAELKAELKARKQQYEYYRNKLLTFSGDIINYLIAKYCPDGVEFKAIGEIAELVRGNGMPKTDFVDVGVGCIHYGQIYTYYGTWTTETKSFVAPEKAARLAKVDPGDLIITNTSENIEDVCKAVAWLGDTQIVTGGHATVIKHKESPKYIAYYLQTPKFFADKKKHATGTKVIDISAKSLAKIKIPIPPLEVQQEIVSILDKFDALVNDISKGLPAEISARKQQYEYYRNKLLTFQEAK